MGSKSSELNGRFAYTVSSRAIDLALTLPTFFCLLIQVGIAPHSFTYMIFEIMAIHLSKPELRLGLEVEN